MKKPFFAALLAACVVVSLAAQEVTDTSALTLLNTNQYLSYFKIKEKEIADSDYIWEALDTELQQFGNLASTVLPDTPLEFALLSYYSQPIINIRPVEADRILPANDPKLSGKKLGAAVLKELTELKFLDPSNTAAIGRYEGMLKFISDKNGVSRAEIESYYRQGIGVLVAETVDAEFNKNYFGFVPSIVYAEWKQKGITRGVDAIALIKEVITDFYISPTQDNYRKLLGISARMSKLVVENKDNFAESAGLAFTGVLDNFNKELSYKVFSGTFVTANANYPNDFRFNVFSIPYGVGGVR
jgi:hypothetical protein